MESTITKEKTDFTNSLWNTYSWFSDVFSNKVQEAFKEFFGTDLTVKLFSIGENSNVLFKGDQYFVTQIRVNKNLTVSMRLSQAAINSFFDDALGQSEKPFKLEELSELEVKIITSFNDFLYTNIRKILVPEEKIDKNETEKSVCHLVFYLNSKGRDYGKLVISIPTNIIEPEKIPHKEQTFSIGDFKHSTAEMKIKVGSSKLKLGEVKSLQTEDILVLENSNIYKMTVCCGDNELDFKISPDPSIILNTDNNEGEDMGENTVSAANLWDSIQVDINAEFEKVKISLGELKQISEGLVVDIGSIYDNRIDLKVENKIVARGELVIINDRYGVRIDEVVKDEEKPEEVDNAPQPAPAKAPAAVSENDSELKEEEFEDEDFNYDDFEEDSNI